MADLTLADLHNPRKVVGLHVAYRRGRVRSATYYADKDQGFQEYPGSWELWQVMENGLLIRVCRWLKRSVVATYTEKEG